MAVRWQWQRALGPRAVAETAELDAYRLAMLNGGASLSVTAAAARLFDTGVLREGDERGALVVDAPLPPDADALERAVFEVVEREPEITGTQLRHELADSTPVQQLKTRLQQVGLLLTPEVITKLGRLKLFGVALFILGGVRIWAGVSNDAPVAYLTVMVVAVAFATALLPRRRPWATARGRALLAGQRKQRSDLSRGGGGLEMPLGIALFGGAALWAAEPAMASTLSVPRMDSWSGGGGSGGGGYYGGSCGGSSGGGDGGGGGCGGGCGGGGS